MATFKSWTNTSALRFFDFALFHGFFQVLTQNRHFFEKSALVGLFVHVLIKSSILSPKNDP